jgi:hypothetical protein
MATADLPGNKTYSLAEATEIICGRDGSGMEDPERWVARQLRSGGFTGVKVGRTWRMSDADIERAFKACRWRRWCPRG